MDIVDHLLQFYYFTDAANKSKYKQGLFYITTLTGFFQMNREFYSHRNKQW